MGWTDRGSDGEDGTDGVSGYQQVFSTPVTLNTLGPTEASAVCPVGKVVLGGSFILPQASPNRRVLVSAPVSNASWLVRVQAVEEDAGGIMVVTAICAAVPDGPQHQDSRLSGGTSTDMNRVLEAGQTSFVVTGAVTAGSPFTAFLNCAGDAAGVLHGTNFLAIKLASLVLQ